MNMHMESSNTDKKLNDGPILGTGTSCGPTTRKDEAGSSQTMFDFKN